MKSYKSKENKYRTIQAINVLINYQWHSVKYFREEPKSKKPKQTPASPRKTSSENLNFHPINYNLTREPSVWICPQQNRSTLSNQRNTFARFLLVSNRRLKNIDPNHILSDKKSLEKYNMTWKRWINVYIKFPGDIEAHSFVLTWENK